MQVQPSEHNDSKYSWQRRKAEWHREVVKTDKMDIYKYLSFLQPGTTTLPLYIMQCSDSVWYRHMYVAFWGYLLCELYTTKHCQVINNCLIYPSTDFCRNGHHSIARSLIIEGHCDVNIPNEFGQTLLHVACR